MADNIRTQPGAGSDPAVATDEIGGAHYQKIKLALGAENELDLLVDSGQQTMANSVPVVIAANQSPVPVDVMPASPAANDYLPVRLTDGSAFYTASGGSGGASQADKSAFTEGTTAFTPVGGTFNESLGADPTEDQAVAARITAKRGLHVNLRNAGGTELGVGAAPVRIDPTGTTAQPVTDNGGSLTVDNGGSFAVQDSQAVADNAGFTDGTSKLFLAGYVFDETAGTALSENDAAAARLNANRAQVLVIEDDATRGRRATVTAAGALKVDGSAVTQPVSGTLAVSSISTSVTPGTAAANLGKAEDAAHTSGDTGVFALAVRNSAAATLTDTDGDYSPIAVNSQGFVLTQTVGKDAHNVAPTGNPVLIAAESRSSEETAVTSGNLSRLQADLVGKLVVRPHCIPEQQVSGVASATTTADTAVIAAPGASIRTYVTSVSVANSSATDAIIEIKDGTTVIWRTAAPQKGGSNMCFDPPLRLSANTALNMASLTAATTIYFSANGYKSAD